MGDDLREHQRMNDGNNHPHHRASDDVILELLRLVQKMDRRLDDHIHEEMDALKDYLVEMRTYIESAFPEKDLNKHKTQHTNWLFKVLFGK